MNKIIHILAIFFMCTGISLHAELTTLSPANSLKNFIQRLQDDLSIQGKEISTQETAMIEKLTEEVNELFSQSSSFPYNIQAATPLKELYKQFTAALEGINDITKKAERLSRFDLEKVQALLIPLSDIAYSGREEPAYFLIASKFHNLAAVLKSLITNKKFFFPDGNAGENAEISLHKPPSTTPYVILKRVLASAAVAAAAFLAYKAVNPNEKKEVSEPPAPQEPPAGPPHFGGDNPSSSQGSPAQGPSTNVNANMGGAAPAASSPQSSMPPSAQQSNIPNAPPLGFPTPSASSTQSSIPKAPPLAPPTSSDVPPKPSSFRRTPPKSSGNKPPSSRSSDTPPSTNSNAQPTRNKPKIQQPNNFGDQLKNALNQRSQNQKSPKAATAQPPAKNGNNAGATPKAGQEKASGDKKTLIALLVYESKKAAIEKLNEAFSLNDSKRLQVQQKIALGKLRSQGETLLKKLEDLNKDLINRKEGPMEKTEATLLNNRINALNSELESFQKSSAEQLATLK